MLPSYALMIFREVLEIGLLLNIANINLNHIKNIKKLNIIALILAIFFSIAAVILMQFTNYFLDESMQEIFDISILSLGVLCIIYNVTTNSKYNFKNTTVQNPIMIVLLLFSIIFREIMEILIFSYSFFSINLNTYFILLNFLIGSIPAILLSFFIAKGLKTNIYNKKIKLLFKITNFIMLIIASSFIVKIFNLLSIFFTFSINIEYLQFLIYFTVIGGTYLYIYKK
ncbi:MAG: hypothetical protein U1E31_02940 [Rickettsiales bacterium]